MNVANLRSTTRSNRKNGIGKKKKHSKEKHRSDRKNSKREPKHEGDGGKRGIDRYHQRSGYKRDDGGSRDIMSNNDRRYQMSYDQRNNDVGAGVRSSVSYHHRQYHQQAQQIHMQQQHQDNYKREGQSYHHKVGGGEYYATHHQQHTNKYGDIDCGHNDISLERQHHKDYHIQKDSESTEEDLRSPLLSKLRMHLRSSDVQKHNEMMAHVIRSNDNECNGHNYEDRATKAEKHRCKHDEVDQRKEHENEKDCDPAETSPGPVKKYKLPDDSEWLACHAKILAAEFEKENREKELEARLTQQSVKSALSPSAVVASVTAGFNIIKGKRRKSEDDNLNKRKHMKKPSKTESNVDNEGDIKEDGEVDSNREDENNKNEKFEKKYNNVEADKTKTNSMELSDEDVELPESPLSFGELPKSPKEYPKEIKKDSEVKCDDEHSSHSGSHSKSHSHSPTSRLHSPSHTHSISRSRSPSRSTIHSLSPAHSSSCSPTSRFRSNSVSSFQSQSRLRSRSHSGERNINLCKSELERSYLTSTDISERKPFEDENSQPRDEKGVPLPSYFPGTQGCRSVEEFQCLNRIEEGTYGVVYRAKDKRTNEIVALKRLKMEKEKEGFPITSLREINTLLKGQHPNIVTVREIVVGSNMDKIFIVMDYVEHDLKALMETMKSRKQFFLPGEVKCLTQQLLRAVNHLHDNWILHRDLKTSNLLLSHKGILKVGDFGLAREYGSPLKKYTSVVVTLWYRAPELLLCSPEYSTPIDIWSVGCIFAEFLRMAPLFPGKTEVEELHKIFKELGTPNDRIWPGYKDLPAVKNMVSQNSQFADYPISNLRKHFTNVTTELGIDLLQGLLTYDPKKRLTAEKALKHGYFKELPLPIDPSMFPTWPAKSELGASKALALSPKRLTGGSQFKQLGRDGRIAGVASETIGSKVISGNITGNKKTATNTGFVLNAGALQHMSKMGPGFKLRF